MWLISKLPQSGQTFVSSVVSNGSARSLLFSAAVARAIAVRLELPSGKVGEINNYYNMTLKLKTYDLISPFIELTMGDYQKIEELIRCFYMQRYGSANPSALITVFSPETAINDVFSIRRYIPEDVLKTIQENATRFMYLQNEASKLLDSVYNGLDQAGANQAITDPASV